MPIGVDKIQSFLAAITAGRAVKAVVSTTKSLVKEGKGVVVNSCFMIHVEAERPVPSLKVVVHFVYMVILL